MESVRMKFKQFLVTAALSLIMSATALQAASPPTISTLEAQVTALQAQVEQSENAVNSYSAK